MTESNDEVIDDVTDVTEDITPDDGNAKLFAKYGIDPDNATTDDLLKIIQRAEKAEKRIVADKKATPKSETPNDIMTKADYAMEKFLDKNPELSEYTKELSEYTKKGLSLEDAKTLVLNSDKAKQNREKTNSLGLSDGETTSTQTSITRSELEKIAKSNQGEYNRIRDLMDSGKMKMR